MVTASATWRSACPTPNDFFGWALTIGDFDDDGCADLAIGVPTESVGSDPEGLSAGAVNVIYGSVASSGLAATGNQFWSRDSAGNQLWGQNSPGIEGTSAAGEQFGHALGAR